MNPAKMPRGVERGRGRGRRTAEERRRDYERELRATPSTISDTSTKHPKFEDTTNDDKNLFPPSDDESTTSKNRKNKALTRSPPSGRQAQKRSEE